MGESRNPVVVVGGGLTALGAVRTFGRRGIDVYLVVDKREVAPFSKYCKGSFMVEGMRCDRSILRNVLVKIGKSFSRRAVVYPTSDLDALCLSELKDELPDEYHFVVGNRESVKILVEKDKFYRALEGNGVNYPDTYFPEDAGDVRRVGSEMTYPVFVRPSIPQLFNMIFGTGRKGFVARSTAELTQYYRLATRHGIKVMFQEIVPGPAKNSYQLEGYYDKDCRSTVLFARQRLRIWPLDFGNTTVCVSTSLAKLAEEQKMLDEFLRKIGYSGVMSAEFKEDARDGVLKLFEINARPWWHFWLSAKCGADILFSSYLDAVGEKTESIEEYELGVKSIYLLNDLRTIAYTFLDGSLSFEDWISSLNGAKTFAFFSKEDLSPFMIDCATQVFLFLKRGLHYLKCKTHARGKSEDFNGTWH